MSGPIPLADWRKLEGVSQKEMARRLSIRLGRTVHAPSICQWENGVMPGADVAEAIRAVTKGNVTGDTFGPRGRPQSGKSRCLPA